jgi:DNA-binding transcriptional LysR family regulator
MNSHDQLDLYTLHLLEQVAAHHNITAAANQVGLSQSALSRQIKGAEDRLGIKVFERSTRKLTLTSAGMLLLKETASILPILQHAVRRVKEEFIAAQSEIRVVLATDLTQAHILGIFHAHARCKPEVKVIVAQENETTLSRAIGQGKHDVGIVTRPHILPQDVLVTHRMKDEYVLLIPASVDSPPSEKRAWKRWAREQSWLLPTSGTGTRFIIDQWLVAEALPITATMEMDDADLMVQLVSLNMGVALVPRRSYSNFGRKKLLQKCPLPRKLQREWIVIIPKHFPPSGQATRFIEGILFS